MKFACITGPDLGWAQGARATGLPPLYRTSHQSLTPQYEGTQWQTVRASQSINIRLLKDLTKLDFFYYEN